MIRLHIAWANALYRWRLFCDRAYDVCHAPLDRGDRDPDVIWWRAQTARMRAEKQAANDDTNPHTPVTTIHRAGIYSDDCGRTVVRDRWGTTVLGETPDNTTTLEATA